jgi:hypothetical protein
MKKYLFSLTALAMIALASCGGKQMDETAIAAKVDSIAAAQIEDITAKTNQDCEARMATEVVTMADSIVKSNK